MILQDLKGTSLTIQTLTGSGGLRFERQVWQKILRLIISRDNVPVQAYKAMYGETSIDSAWRDLGKLYCHKDLVAIKLKLQLKNGKPKGKKDQDIVIDLVTEVNYIMLRLKLKKTLLLNLVLVADSRFLSSVYRVLPPISQRNCPNLSLYTSKWE